MPPLVGVAIAAAASSGAVGAALGLGTSIAGLISGTVAAALDSSVVIGDIVAGAAVGATAGAGTALAGGTSVSKGLLYGAATGGATAGLTPVVGDALGVGQDAAQAITSGVVTTGSTLAQGVPLGKALEYGATAGAGNYLGSKLFDIAQAKGGGPVTDQTTSAPSDVQPAQLGGIERTSIPLGSLTAGATPDYTGQTADQVQGIERTSIPVGSIPPYTAPTVSPDTSAPPQGNAAPETVTVPGQQSSVPTTGNVFISPSGTETANVTANAAPSSNITSDQGLKTAEKGALEAALFDLLFPQSKGSAPQYTGAGGGASTTPTSGTGGAPVGSATPTPGGLSPAALAALNSSVGQTGGTSIYSPGGPLFGAPTGGRYNAWNKSSLRTDQGTG